MEGHKSHFNSPNIKSPVLKIIFNYLTLEEIVFLQRIISNKKLIKSLNDVRQRYFIQLI